MHPRLLIALSALLLTGCVRSIVLYAHPELPHEEAVSRLTRLLKEEAVLGGDMAGGSERKFSATRTQVTYGHVVPRPAPGLHTPAAVHDRTVFEFNTSARGYVAVSFKSCRAGNFMDERLHESEAAIAKRLVSIRTRADDALRRPPSNPP